MVMRTGHLFVQCVDRHGHEDMTLICAVCGQTWSRGQDIYLCFVWTDMVMRTGHLFVCSVWTDMVMRTGHLFVQCVDRHGHEDRTLVHMHPE